ncbi:MAG: Ig domain protein group 2 domain protein, partial [Bryobacterales bacterium]|nr:Ig domain protein group 2 domain protein [Bryobacterales bacterium]
ALAGSPVQKVSGPVLAKWANLHYETGAAGTPAGAATAFNSQSGYSGFSQAFSGGPIYGITNSGLGGQAFFVSGLVLARYLALGGPAGEMGVPLTDQFPTGGDNRQNFENGYINYLNGAGTAQEHLTPRTPSVSANPGTALAGSRLHLAISGFADGATVRVSISGQLDFLVTTPNGSYSWDVYVPPASASATVKIHAADTTAAATADGSYTIKSLLDSHAQLSKAQGDNQTGAPATILASPLIAVLQDAAGVPIPNVTVAFTASPGAQVTPASVVTDATGRAATLLRLPGTGGVAAVTARAVGQIVIFNARATGSAAISNFPQYSQASITSQLGNGPSTGLQKGAAVTAAAAVLRYYQSLGSVPAANGLADPNSLNQYLKADCHVDLSGAKGCDGFVSNPDSGEQVVNLWRLVDFVGSGVTVSVEDTALTSIAALVSSGDPVLLNLTLTEDGVAAGGTTVVATGIASDGSLQISDPNPGFAQTNLNGYLGGFGAGGHTWQGTVLSAVRLLPRTPSPSGFLLSAVSQPVAGFPNLSAASEAGSCTAPLVVQDAAVYGLAAMNPVRQSEFVYCDGSQSGYQISISAPQPYRAVVTDLSSAGSTRDLSGPAPAGYQVSRTNGQLTVTAPAVSFASSSVVNAASFSAAIAPGELISVFGSGLAGPGSGTTVTLDGLPAQVLLATPFQVNAVIPTDVTPGSYPLAVTSPFGSVSQSVIVQPAAPGIFILATNADGSVTGAVVNQDGSINGPTNPLSRGKVLTVYCTGLGAVTNSGGLSVTTATVQGILGGNTLPVAFSGLTPGFVGLYQVNVSIPTGTPPGLTLPFNLRAGSADSNIVSVAVQ